MQFSPLKHQKIAIDHLIGHDEALLFAGMGLGKTAACLSAIDWLFADGDCKGLLVVAPLRVSVLTWPDEIKKWCNFRYLNIADLRTKEGLRSWEAGESHIYTINYASLPKITKSLFKGKRAQQLPVDSVLFDEVDKAKGNKSKRINIFRKYGRPKLKRCWGMTGTPTPNNRLDLFSQVRLIDQGKTFGKYITPWKEKYFEPDNPWSNYPKLILRYGAEELLERKIAHLACVLRSEDWLDIPPVKEVDIEVSLPAKIKAEYKKFEKELIHQLQNDNAVVAANAAVLVGKLQQFCSGVVYYQDEQTQERKTEFLHDKKLMALMKLHSHLEQKPLLVACQFRHEMEMILDKIPWAEKFQEGSLERWNRGEIKMLIAHPKSIGHGLNLQAGGSNICWFSLTYSRGLYDQFNARLARQGQSSETTIFRLVCSGLVDDAIANALETKGNDQSLFVKTLLNITRLAAA